MAKKKKQIGEKLQKQIHDAADTVKAKAGDIDLPDIKVPEKVKDIFEKDESDEVPMEIEGAKALSTTSAMRIIYYLMAVDGEIFHAEEDKFNLIGEELDPNFKDNRETIIRRCQAHMEKTQKQEDYYDVIRRGVKTSISLSKPTKDSFITPKLLIWDLLSIAYSDNHYDKTERELIRYIVKRLNVNETEFLEMESSFLTLVDIQKEIEWVKTTDRQYKEIEEVVNELADRKAVIMESVNDLITL